MLSMLISLVVLLLIFAVFWWILTMIPVPPEFVWVVRVAAAVVFLIALVSLLTGAWAFPFGHVGHVLR
jgi:hypothetical protein